MKVRYESFGGIISLEESPALLYVDKDCMKQIGYKHSDMWDEDRDFLSAPTEVHFSITNECPMGCKHCYVSSGDKLADELNTDELKRAIIVLSKLQVFHIAFGGGEPFAREDFLEIARFCRDQGIVPNVTTNGYYITEEIAKQCNVFGQINVSLDGIGRKYRKIRGIDGFRIADNALKMLTKYHSRVGINCVVTRENFDELTEIVDYASNSGIGSVLFLRFKPSGRASRELYHEMRLTSEQNRRLLPLIFELYLKYKIVVQVDCSFTPMIYYHRIDPEVLDFLSVHGCSAGNSLAGILPDGKINGCSFCKDTGGDIFNFKSGWLSNLHFNRFREWTSSPPKSCSSCEYLSICRGGCHVVSEAILGDFSLPDPECPWVEELH